MAELSHVVNESKYKPAIIFKHDPASNESNTVKAKLDSDWAITPEQVDVYLVDILHQDVSQEISELAGIDHETPQIVLFADGVTMYDESSDMISFKKIRLALKIVNRTFRWLETRA
ncbi:MAG: DUF2847 family protein [Cyclobacteriaceae bacterium]